MSNSISLITNKKKIDKKEVTVANNDKLTIDCVGDVQQNIVVNGKRENITISNVHYVPNICANLLSVSEMVKKKHTVIFNIDGCKIFDSDWNLLATASLVNDLFKLDVVPNEKSFIVENQIYSVVAKKPKENSILWHRRLGHTSFNYMNFLNKDIKSLKIPTNSICETCVKGKHSRKPFSESGHCAKQLLELVHTDLLARKIAQWQ